MPQDLADPLKDSPTTELAASRTAMALERTRMAADRTLMAILRTAFSMISFGFTIFKFFHDIGEKMGIRDAMAIPARNFGLSLVVLGVGLLVAGLYNHWRSIMDLGLRRDALHKERLLRHAFVYRPTPTGMVAVLLLLMGLLVILGIVARIGPFG